MLQVPMVSIVVSFRVLPIIYLGSNKDKMNQKRNYNGNYRKDRKYDYSILTDCCEFLHACYHPDAFGANPKP